MKILQICAYGAEYKGNFIASLELLEKEMKKKGYETIYAFSESAKNKSWCYELQKRTNVYFLPIKKAKILPKTYRICQKIFKENNIDIVHSHFELYDIPVTVTAPKQTKVFWHLHDALADDMKLSRKILEIIQYKYIAKRNVSLISVADYYRKKVVQIGFPEKNTYTVKNGINTDYINKKNTESLNVFLTFGWDFHRKGADLIFNACQKLEYEGYQFKIVFNGNAMTWPILNNYFSSNIPSWLVLENPRNDVNSLYEMAGVFIQASRVETFSYAVCEAAYSGLLVIASDIPGLEWAKEIPTVKFFEKENSNQLFLLMKAILEKKYVIDKKKVDITRQIIEDKYSLQEWSNKIMELYGV